MGAGMSGSTVVESRWQFEVSCTCYIGYTLMNRSSPTPGLRCRARQAYASPADPKQPMRSASRTTFESLPSPLLAALMARRIQ